MIYWMFLAVYLKLKVARKKIEAGMNVVDFLAEAIAIKFFSSKGEIRRSIKGNGISINKEKVKSIEATVTVDDLIADKYILIQKGKKKYCLAIII